MSRATGGSHRARHTLASPLGTTGVSSGEGEEFRGAGAAGQFRVETETTGEALAELQL
jgi:hypothetical protein